MIMAVYLSTYYNEAYTVCFNLSLTFVIWESKRDTKKVRLGVFMRPFSSKLKKIFIYWSLS